jgi:hypothetical protein
MSIVKALGGLCCALVLVAAVYAFQRPFREYPSVEYGYMQLPPDWKVFEQSMKLVFPDRPIVEIPNTDPIFHTIFDLDDRFQIVGAEHLMEGSKNGGKVPHWRGIYDDKGRIMVAITFNSDVGDSWEWAGDPRYPQKFSEMGIRLGVNYIIYAMTR